MFNFITQLLVSLTIVSVTVYCQLCGDPQKTVDQAFIDSGIVKDLNIKLPSDGLDLIEVTYSNAISSESVSCGTELKSYQTFNEPMIKYPAQSNANYTFMMLDLDAPSPRLPTSRSFIHWMVVNVEGDNLESGSNTHSYISPGPPPGSGQHRYVFLVFEQHKKFAMRPNATILNRNNFNVAEWAEQKTISGLVSGNYFLQQNP